MAEADAILEELRVIDSRCVDTAGLDIATQTFQLHTIIGFGSAIRENHKC